MYSERSPSFVVYVVDLPPVMWKNARSDALQFIADDEASAAMHRPPAGRRHCRLYNAFEEEELRQSVAAITMRYTTVVHVIGEPNA